MKTIVLNIKTQKVGVETAKSLGLYVPIHRPSQWGNPFRVGRDGTRDEVVEKYRQWVRTQPKLLKQIPSLRGKYLGCMCFPRNCHGMVLKELADG